MRVTLHSGENFLTLDRKKKTALVLLIQSLWPDCMVWSAKSKGYYMLRLGAVSTSDSTHSKTCTWRNLQLKVFLRSYIAYSHNTGYVIKIIYHKSNFFLIFHD